MPDIIPADIPYGYCHCGCGERTTIAKANDPRDNVVKGQPVRFIRGHAARHPNFKRKPTMPMEERFWQKVQKSEGCWLWQGTTDQNGYGIFAMTARKNIGAHRLMWILIHGVVPENLFVLHRCPEKANPLCVNPDHLYAGTQYENVQDSLREGTHFGLTHPYSLATYVAQHPEVKPRGEAHKNSKLTDESVREIHALYPQHSMRAIAVRYGVSSATIGHILHGLIWRHVSTTPEDHGSQFAPLASADKYHRNAKLVDADVLTIRALADTVSHADLAQRFGVSHATIHRIVYRKAWTHI